MKELLINGRTDIAASSAPYTSAFTQFTQQPTRDSRQHSSLPPPGQGNRASLRKSQPSSVGEQFSPMEVGKNTTLPTNSETLAMGVEVDPTIFHGVDGPGGSRISDTHGIARFPWPPGPPVLGSPITHLSFVPAHTSPVDSSSAHGNGLIYMQAIPAQQVALNNRTPVYRPTAQRAIGTRPIPQTANLLHSLANRTHTASPPQTSASDEELTALRLAPPNDRRLLENSVPPSHFPSTLSAQAASTSTLGGRPGEQRTERGTGIPSRAGDPGAYSTRPPSPTPGRGGSWRSGR